MGDPARGITDENMRRVVREAIGAGWEFDGFSGTTHARIRWPGTGETLAFGTTPSVASWKSLATDIKRVSGVEVWRKGNRKRSRKACRPSGFDPGKAARDLAAWHRDHEDLTTELLARRQALIDECIRRAKDRGLRQGIPERVTEIAAIERTLPPGLVEPFDPLTLADHA